MYILYLDESGTHGEASYFVLAGLAVFEREIYWYDQDLEALQTEYFPSETSPVFFHASRLNVREGDKVEVPWDQLTGQQRGELKREVHKIISSRQGVLFGCAIERQYSNNRREEPYERAFEDLLRRFDLYLSRLNAYAKGREKEEQRGMIVLAESSYQKAIKSLAHRLDRRGTRWGSLHNIVDVPLFAPARDTRLLQYADFCSNAVYGRYHTGLTRDFDIIAGKFDSEEGIMHGLSHLTTNSQCACVACFSRQDR